MAFPLNHFVGLDPGKLKVLDQKLHGVDKLKTLKLADFEIKEILDKALAAPEVNSQLKEYLTDKRQRLVKFRDVTIKIMSYF